SCWPLLTPLAAEANGPVRVTSMGWKISLSAATAVPAWQANDTAAAAHKASEAIGLSFMGSLLVFILSSQRLSNQTHVVSVPGGARSESKGAPAPLARRSGRKR